jgi:hypothetical protein
LKAYGFDDQFDETRKIDEVILSQKQYHHR